MKRILVIGGTGFIGYHVIKEAKKRGIATYSVSLNNPKKKRYVKGVKYIKVDVTKTEDIKNKINKNYDYVINAGGYGSHPDFGKKGDTLIKSHFLGLINILETLKKKKLKKFVQIGSSAEYGNINAPIKETAYGYPQTPYAIAKLSCTKFLLHLYLTQKFPVVILRLFQVYGSNQATDKILPFLIKNCKKNKKFLTTSGKQYCDFCHIDDVVNAIFKSLFTKKTSGEIFNIGSGKKVQIEYLIKLVKKLIGKGKPILGGIKYKKGTNMMNFPNINKAKSKLNWKPKISLMEVLQKIISSFK